jgi:magnesium transporter
MITIVDYDPETKHLTILEQVDWRKFEAKQNHLYWWDLEDASPEETAVLSQHFHFHPLAISDCIGDVHYPKVDFYGTYLYMVIHGVDADRSEIEGFVPKELDIFLGADYLLTYHKLPMRSIGEVHRRCKEDSPIFAQGTDFVLYTILDVLVSNYFPVLDGIEDQLDQIEEAVFDKPKPELL